MQGYSFRSLTDLVLKIFKTKVNAGIGLSGGGSLEADRTLSVNYGTTAGTAAQGDDSRLSDSREWKEATIPQAEAEAGVATTRRAFTAQRVRQATVAWFNGFSGALGRTILTRTTAAQVQSDIGLGTAATRNVGTDTGQVMEVGAFGLGNSIQSSVYPSIPSTGARIIHYINPGVPGPLGISQSDRTSYLEMNSNSHRTTIAANSSALYFSWVHGRTPTPSDFKRLLSTGDLLQTTGSSAEFPMSQKATTDQLATKVNTSTQVIAGTGLSGGGNLLANRTLIVNYGTTAGTAAQGNDSRLSDSREWIAETVSQAEAEAGVATTRRAFTAQRVRQAIVAWWNSITGTFGRDLVTSASNTAARDKLGLFTSALRWPTWAEVTSKPTTFTPSPHTHPWSQVTEQPATATRWPSFAEVTDKPTNYSTIWDSVAAKPAQATRWPTWAEVTGKPSSSIPIGVGQTWQNMIASRVRNTTYTNTTGRSIMIFLQRAGLNYQASLTIGTLTVFYGHAAGSIGQTGTISMVIPPNATYSSTSFNNWWELR